MTLCDLCKNHVGRCGVEPAHCMCRTAESHVRCDGNTDFAPFTPIEGLDYSREHVITQWKKHIK